MMNIDTLKQALQHFLNPAEIDSETDPVLLTYLQDVLTQLNASSTPSKTMLVCFLTQIQRLLFQHEGEPIVIEFNHKTYVIQSLYLSYSFIEQEIHQALLTPLSIEADTDLHTIEALVQTQFLPPPLAPAPLLQPQESLDVNRRFQNFDTRGVVTQEPSSLPMSRRQNDAEASRATRATRLHPLEFNLFSMMFRGVHTFFDEDRDTDEDNESIHHGFW